MRTMGPPSRHAPAAHAAGEDRPLRPGPWDALKRLWHTEKPGVALARDMVLVLVVVVVLIGGLWAYSGQALGQAPIVVVESGSMMHPDAAWGRIGTIDPGDLVLVKRVDPDRIATAYDGGGRTAYGGHGDVIVFYRMGDRDTTPIIHRALTWVEATPTPDGDGFRYDYRNQNGEMVTAAASLDLPEVGIAGMRPPASGFVTKGDNPVTNQAADPVTHLSGRLVEPDWIIGTAKGQAPWIGLVKLALTGTPEPAPHATDGQCRILRAWAPCDAWAALGLSLAALIAVPIILEILRRHSPTLRRWTS